MIMKPITSNEENKKCKYDIVLVCIGIFELLCILCIILLLTIPNDNSMNDNSNVNVNNVNTSNKINNNNSNLFIPNMTVYNYIKMIGLYFIVKNHTYTNYTLISFNGNGVIQFIKTTTCNVLIVGGGGGVGWGGGGLSGGSGTGGGGGGGVGEGTLIFIQDELYTITVGEGGRVGHNLRGGNGGDSMIVGKGVHETAFGGGYGGYYDYKQSVGGSSGGCYGFSGNITVQGQYLFFNNTQPGNAYRGDGSLTYHGNVGGHGIENNAWNPGCGGGGAGTPGGDTTPSNGGNGGDGYQWVINREFYGGGGGGGGSGRRSARRKLCSATWTRT